MTTRALITVGIVPLLLAPAIARADTYKVGPSKAVVLPDDQSGEARVALEFDLSGMRDGTGREIDLAFIEWVVPGVPSDKQSVYEVHELIQSWTVVGVNAGIIPLNATDAARIWVIDKRDHQRHGGLVRVKMRDLVEAWVKGTKTNHGVLLTMTEVSRDGLANDLENARLVVKYAFIDPNNKLHGDN